MNKEFKIISENLTTRYVLETTSGATSSAVVATAEKPLGELQRRETMSVPVNQKPRQGPLKPQTGGGKHRDKKKEQKSGKEKHRKPFAEDHEISMASNELQSIAADAKKLLMLVKRYSEMEGLEAWQQSKITKAADYMTSVLRSIGGEQGALGSTLNEYETHTYKDSQGNVWRVNDEGEKELISAAPGGGYGGGSRYGSRYPRRPAVTRSSGMYFYNVKSGQENDAMKAGLKQSKSGKWYSTFSNPVADKQFGPGKFWQPKSESVSEGNTDRHLDQSMFEEFGTDPTQPGTWNGHTIVANRKTSKGSFLILKNKNDGQYEIHKQSPGVAGGLEFVSVHKTPDEMQAAFKKLTGVDESKKNVAEEKQKGVDGKACWKGYKRMGTKKKGGRTVDNCVKVGEDAYTEHLFSTLDEIVNEKAPPGDKYERMVKHIKKGYSKDGKLTDVEKRKAYGAAWKAKNKSKK